MVTQVNKNKGYYKVFGRTLYDVFINKDIIKYDYEASKMK